MTTIIVNPAKENAKSRKYRKTGEFFARKDADRLLAKRIDKAFKKLSEGCSDKVVRAASLGSLRDKPAQEEVTDRKNRRIYYRDTNPLGNKIHAVQKMRGKSIPVYVD